MMLYSHSFLKTKI